MGKEKISILVVRDFGKAKGYRISFGLFKKIVVLSVCLFVLTVASLFGFFHLFWERKRMQEGIESLTMQIELAKKQVKEHEKVLKESKEQLALLRAGSKHGSKKAYESRALPDINKESMEKSDVKRSPELRALNKAVEIRNFRKIRDQEASRLRVSFDLLNQDPQHRTVEGRIIVVATKDQPGSPLHISFPWAPLRSGRPMNTTSGYRFSIKRFKEIKGYFEKPSMDLRFDKFTVFVYASDGKLILEKVFIFEDR